ncbi:chromosome segregation protein SMC [Candidatus Magnetomorum sp. HK-1]|nr:chromosome segregation protein SMC [Candidatus Magnetomorum sp. HK-1]
MLTQITIRNFKSILDQEFFPGLMNIFIGANGSGKSNILEAIGVLSSSASGTVDDESLQRRGVRLGIPGLYKSAFKEKRTAPHLFFEAKTDNAQYSVALNHSKENSCAAWEYQTEELISDDEIILKRSSKKNNKNNQQGYAALKRVDMIENNSYVNASGIDLLNTLQNYAIYYPNTPVLRGIIPDLQPRAPVGLSGGRLADAIIELQHLISTDAFIEDAFDDILTLIDWASSFDTTSNGKSILSPSVARTKNIIRFTDKYMKTKNNQISAYDASEGLLYILFCSVLLLSPSSPRCFAIDNLDQALNPRLILNLAQLLCKWFTQDKKSPQLFFTAHNPAVLDGLNLTDDRIRLFTVDRNNQGHTEISRIVMTEELLKLSSEKGWALSRLWLMGHLGGVPNV